MLESFQKGLNKTNLINPYLILETQSKINIQVVRDNGVNFQNFLDRVSGHF